MKQSKRTVFIAMLALAAILVSSAAFAAEEIKVGALFPLTGPAAVSGQNCVNAVQAAVEVINKKNADINDPLAAQEGLVGGKYVIKVVPADHQGKPDVAKSEAERLYNQEKVFAIIGCYNSSATKPASAVAERAKKLFLCGCSSSAALTERGYKYFFRHAPTDAIESVEFVDYIAYLNKEKNAGIKTLGIIYENTEFGKHAAEEAIKAAKKIDLKIVADVPFNNGATNLNSEVQKLKSANPDVVFGAALGGDYSLWVRTMKQVNWLPKMAINYCTGYQNPAVQKELGSDGNFFMGGMGYSPELAKQFMPEGIKIQDKYYTPKSNQPFDSDSIQEAVMMMVLAQAIEKAGGPDTEKVREIIATQEFPSTMSLSGKVKFAADGQNAEALSVITQLHEQSYKTVFPLKYKDFEPTFPMTPWDKR
ncbi:MAG: ABC transporter substrate-binding protein [Synergistes sp.]|nr:ABC transporter substrate-binding protein [Synergistes sp.]MCR5335440.1 ABC transporter substrate-binding protein [Synergistes sp.]